MLVRRIVSEPGVNHFGWNGGNADGVMVSSGPWLECQAWVFDCSEGSVELVKAAGPTSHTAACADGCAQHSS